MRDMKATTGRLEAGMNEVKLILARMDGQFAHLATKADPADKPGKLCMWGILATLLAAYGSGLAALAIL